MRDWGPAVPISHKTMVRTKGETQTHVRHQHRAKPCTAASKYYLLLCIFAPVPTYIWP